MSHSEGWEQYPCIEWQGKRHNQGYGLTDDRKQLAHRVAFMEHYGYLPGEPYVVDHMCRNRVCVQPLHLQVVTRAENTRLGTARRELPETCPKGHNEWRVRKNGSRRCWRCHIIAETERNRRKRGSIPSVVG